MSWTSATKSKKLDCPMVLRVLRRNLILAHWNWKSARKGSRRKNVEIDATGERITKTTHAQSLSGQWYSQCTKRLTA